ncbi:MAG: DNA-binding protein [Planctomycetaceae bacterium]|nr:DNA-binding protein [Planctomycetaceae bacterium]
MRLEEAKALLEAEQWPGAYHLTGLAVECALKAWISRQTRANTFPLRDGGKLYVHEAEKLVAQGGLTIHLQSEKAANPPFAIKWALVAQWSVDSRYDANTSEALAKDLYSAVTNRRSGVLRWIRRHW